MYLKKVVFVFPGSPNEHHTHLTYRPSPLHTSTSPSPTAAPRVSRQRLPARDVFYHRSPEHRNHYILSFAFAFDREEDVYQFSVCFPYSYSRLQLHLSEVEKLKLPWVRRQLLTSTVVGGHCSL